MTRHQIHEAVKEGAPFEIRMASGERHCVSDRYQVALRRSTAIVVGEDDMPQILPLPAMTGLTYLKDSGESGGREQASGGNV